MTTAIFGFLGVLVGALATTASTWFFTRRKEKQEESVAVRLIREDVILAGSTLATVLSQGWLPEFELPLDDWNEYRSNLAGHLSMEDWDEVAAAMGYLSRIQLMLSSAGDENAVEADAIPLDAKEVITSAIERLKKANVILHKRARSS